MKNSGAKVCVLIIITLATCSAVIARTWYAQEVIDHSQEVEMPPGARSAEEILGPPDARMWRTNEGVFGEGHIQFNEVDPCTPGFVVVGFGPGVRKDVDGNDIVVHLIDWREGVESFEVFAGDDVNALVSLGVARPSDYEAPTMGLFSVGFDLAHAGLSSAKYVKIVNGSIYASVEWEGPDLDAVEIVGEPAIIFVDGDANGANNGWTWKNAFKYLQDGLMVARNGDEIRVGEGVYTPDINSADPNGSRDRRATFRLKSAVVLKGGYAGFGQPDPNARSIALYKTILSGDLDGNDVDVNDPCDLLSEPTRTENSYHVVTGSGTDSTAVLDGFTIKGGTANGPRPDRCGGGMFTEFGSPTVLNCGFEGNWAISEGGGVYTAESRPTVMNCLFTGNGAFGRGGGAMHSFRGNVTVSNCTFSRNWARLDGAGMSGSGSNAVVTNCILWGNLSSTGTDESTQIRRWGLTVNLNYNCIQGWSGLLGGIGNIGADPCFVDPGKGDYHLLSDSPCIDAGDPNYVPAPNEADLDGNPRAVDGDNDGNSVVDMGAYEFFVPPIEVEMRFTPQALNPESKGRWVKAHLVLPEGFGAGDVDANRPAVIEPGGIESEYMNVFINEDGFVEIEAAFGRGQFCDAGIGDEAIEIMVIGSFTNGQQFYGTDTVKITNNILKYLGALASHWLDEQCGKPDWCGGVDADQDGVVDFVDFALFDGCCIEIVPE